MTQSLRVMPPVVYPGKFIFPLEKFNYFSLLEVPIVLGFLFKKKKFIQVKSIRPSLWMYNKYNGLHWL